MRRRALPWVLSVVAGLSLAACVSSPPAEAPPPPPPPVEEEQTPPSPLLIPFGDSQDWIVAEDMTYVIGSTSERIVVPRGFVTDFASIPEGLTPFGLTAHGQYSRAAIVHDYLYWSQGCTRSQADRLMVIAMKESGTGTVNENLIYRGVDLGGQGAWDANTRQRARNLPRVVPAEYIPPGDPNVSWPRYREMLVKNRVRDPAFVRKPSYCVYGDTTRVP